MLMNQILDSSTLRGQGDGSRPLKRSSSVASLPTPPRTKHKSSRSRPRSSLSHHDPDASVSGSELDDDLGGGYAKRIKRAKNTRGNQSMSESDEDSAHSEDESPERKKRRMLAVLPGHDEEEEDENTFWTGRGGSPRGGKQDKKVGEAEAGESSPSPALLRYRVKAPVSPPPSRRLPSIQPARAASVERDSSSATPIDPVTPPRKLFLRAVSPPVPDTFKTPTKPAVTKIWPKRDSPNNPFLVESNNKAKSHSEWDGSDDDEVVGEARIREESPTPTYEEKPTITYVFRGQKATFHNPLYGLSSDVIAASKLPINHPDYEAAEACPPKRLFFSAGKCKSRDYSRENNSAESVKRAKVQLTEEDHNENSEVEQETNALKKLAPVDSVKAETTVVATEQAREERERRETMAKSRLAPRDGLRTGAIFSERDDPARRAMGPLRSA